MKCPVCRTSELTSVNLEEYLQAQTCPQCEGNWISAEDYQQWLDKHGETLPQKEPEISFDLKDNTKAKLCPQCQRILIKYKVGHGVDFFLDHCSSCNGVWFDKNEWKALKERNLHDEVHYIFTKSWQKKIRDEEVREMLDSMYVTKFGKETYEEAKRIRAWLEEQPETMTLLAFLGDENPYEL
ncbi:MAG: zf-TFIIB domain-containing protein [Spirulina sp.]